jgi:hypothetical protein
MEAARDLDDFGVFALRNECPSHSGNAFCRGQFALYEPQGQ